MWHSLVRISVHVNYTLHKKFSTQQTLSKRVIYEYWNWVQCALTTTCGVALKVHGNVCLVTSVGPRQIGLLFEHIPSTNFPAEEGFVANSLICAQKIQPEIKTVGRPQKFNSIITWFSCTRCRIIFMHFHLKLLSANVSCQFLHKHLSFDHNTISFEILATITMYFISSLV